jgi:surface polysaccharide O-acyltransferase-like enzyme
LIVFVVFIHNGLIRQGVNFSDGTTVYQISDFVQKIDTLVSCITCAAVPLFFIIAGYLLYIKGNIFSRNIKKNSEQ